MAAKAASSEAVRAGSPENEFMLARPVSLAALVTARGLADAVTDPVGALFLLPVLIAAAAWSGTCGGAAWPVAAATSMLVQVGDLDAGLCDADRGGAFGAARRAGARSGWRCASAAALALATLWMLGTWVLRAPAVAGATAGGAGALAARGRPARSSSPRWRCSRAARSRRRAGACRLLALAAAGAMLAAAAVARRAGMHGWEEAGAPWAEARARARAAGRARTAATKDLRSVVRDRPQLLALVAMPIIFVGIQIFGRGGLDLVDRQPAHGSRCCRLLAGALHGGPSGR